MSGLTLDPNTGKITGSPKKPGNYTVTVTAKDAAGNKITQEVKITLGVLSWSKGDYNGRAFPFGTGDRPGYFTFSIAANGKVSGKVSYKDKQYSFKAECNYSSTKRLLFKPQITIGKKTFEPGYITIAQRNLSLSGTVVEGKDDNGLVLVQKPTGLLASGGHIAEVVGREFVLTSSDANSGLKAGDELKVLVTDYDSVSMTGTVNGKRLYGRSAGLRLENFFKRGNGSVYVFYTYLFDESLNYYKVIAVQVTQYLQQQGEELVYVFVPICYACTDEYLLTH